MKVNYIKQYPKSERARVGRKFQHIGAQKVKKYAFSPYTAKKGVVCRFFCDLTIAEPMESPKGVKTTELTIPLEEYTLRGFKRALKTGEVRRTIDRHLADYNAVLSSVDGYWRNAGRND